MALSRQSPRPRFRRRATARAESCVSRRSHGSDRIAVGSGDHCERRGRSRLPALDAERRSPTRSFAPGHDMLEEKDAAAPAPAVAMRDEDGALRAEFVEHVAQAIGEDDSTALRGLVGDLHAADLGDVIEALEPELRPRLVLLLGRDFDFLALTEVDGTIREAILKELGAAAAA